MEARRYFYFIDLLRWIAAMCVLIHHYVSHFYVSSDVVKDSKIFSFIVDKAVYGSYGVWFFWCVSGFVFTNILLNQKTTLLEFSIKRFARLYPLHFLTLFIVAMLEFYSFNKFGNFQIEKNIYDLYHFILNLFFISGWGLENGFSFNGVVWSVSIEIPVYFAFFYMMRFFKKNLLIYIFVFLIIFKLLLHAGNTSTSSFLFNYNFKSCFFYFLFGSFIYLFSLKFERYKKTLLTISILSFLSWPFFSYIENLEYLSTIKNLIPSTLVLFGSLILFAFFIENNYKKIGKKFIFLGNASYAIYLTHLPLQILILIFLNLNFFETQVFFSLKIFFLFLIMVNVISIITFKYFENPLRKKINSF